MDEVHLDLFKSFVATLKGLLVSLTRDLYLICKIILLTYET